jgi:hypothetical protein
MNLLVDTHVFLSWDQGERHFQSRFVTRLRNPRTASLSVLSPSGKSRSSDGAVSWISRTRPPPRSAPMGFRRCPFFRKTRNGRAIWCGIMAIRSIGCWSHKQFGLCRRRADTESRRSGRPLVQLANLNRGRLRFYTNGGWVLRLRLRRVWQHRLARHKIHPR